ncbi:Error-prone repair protein ImuA [Mucilaginibacter sp. RS28]|uniref:Error-prone repair protein ImuA n=1 Tax=Mucilaginibacter straminoryzae TaxID=2932774 RepID=A0A9X2BCX9_9SPHI|nr:Error-prone repair protein ImuA [Mucilaginibacter straminoryzae]MCJ8209748.1 Error-prone repair protein ImuA [Mucilaginibacter straminoryzae]
MQASKASIIQQLQQKILSWQGFASPAAAETKRMGLGPLEDAFPNGVFPTGAIHEMLCPTREQGAATAGLLSGIVTALMKNGGVCLWISADRRLYPPALLSFNILPEQVIFIDVAREKDVLWAMEEALKCEGLAAVVAEVREVSFAQSRRLQLAVEDSKVTGFLLRTDLKKLTTTTCVARWQITHLPGALPDGLPGVGFPRWQVELLRVRNGNPGSWIFEWNNKGFVPVEEPLAETEQHLTRQVG